MITQRKNDTNYEIYEKETLNNSGVQHQKASTNMMKLEQNINNDAKLIYVDTWCQ